MLTSASLVSILIYPKSHHNPHLLISTLTFILHTSFDNSIHSDSWALYWIEYVRVYLRAHKCEFYSLSKFLTNNLNCETISKFLKCFRFKRSIEALRYCSYFNTHPNTYWNLSKHFRIANHYRKMYSSSIASGVKTDERKFTHIVGGTIGINSFRSVNQVSVGCALSI